MTTRAVLAVALALPLLDCGKAPPPDACTVGPTWTSTVALIVHHACLPCHSAGATDRHGALPGHDFDTYQEVKSMNLGAFVDAVTALREPPMNNTLMLATTPQERSVIKEWELCGFAE